MGTVNAHQKRLGVLNDSTRRSSASSIDDHVKKVRSSQALLIWCVLYFGRVYYTVNGD